MQLFTVTNDPINPVLLEYSLSASKHPITVSPETGDPVFVTLEFVVSKPKGAEDVQLTHIIFTFPFGDASYDLTPAALTESNASISTSGKEKWKIDALAANKGTFKVHSVSGKPLTISDQGLTITFSQLQINRAVGTVDVKITEKATNDSSAPANRHHTKHVPKFPKDFFLTGFSSTAPSVKHNEKAKLVWHGSDGPEYLMLWGQGPGENVSRQKTWDSPQLTSTTTFMLQVKVESGESVTHRANVTVIVESPDLVATSMVTNSLRIGPTSLRKDGDTGVFVLDNPHGMLWMGLDTVWITKRKDTDKNRLTLTSDGALNFRKFTVTSDGALNFRKFTVAPDGGVGIGTTNPQNALDVNGGVVIGSAYAGSTAAIHKAPADGLKVQGEVRLNAGVNIAQNLNVMQDLTVQSDLEVERNLTVQGKATLNADLNVQKDLVVQGNLTVQGKIMRPSSGGVVVIGDLLTTGRLTSSLPIEVYFPDKQQWYRMAVGRNDWAQFDPFSDLRLKENVRPIPGALDKVLKLEGKLYRWNEKGLDALTRDVVNRVSAGPDATEEQHEALRREERQKAVEKLSGDHHGLVAQEVEAVLPEAVSETEDGHKYIRYPQLVALLVEAVKEQAAQIQTLSEKVSALAESLRNKPS